MRACALAAICVLIMGAAEECEAEPPAGDNTRSCAAWISQKPHKVKIAGDTIIEAIVSAKCSQPQAQHVMHVELDRKDEFGNRRDGHMIIEKKLPRPGRVLDVPISHPSCEPGAWRVRFWIVGENKAGERYRYPRKDWESASKGLRC